MELAEQFQPVMIDLEPLFATIAADKAGAQNQFKKAIKASLVKAYEFLNATTTIQDESVFFMMPFLRGVCEDYIALRFIESDFGADADHVIGLKLSEDLYASAINQWNFYTIYRPDQTLYYQENFPDEKKDVRNDLRQLCQAHGISLSRNASFPTAEHMAQRSGLLDLYNYVYRATSRLVHFNPGILFRMGWGDLPDITFSVKNFSQYYKHFTCFYAAYLLVHFGQWAASIGVVSPAIEPHLQRIDALLGKEARWPELVTFEEMNIGPFSKYLLFKSPARHAAGQQGDPV